MGSPTPSHFLSVYFFRVYFFFDPLLHHHQGLRRGLCGRVDTKGRAATAPLLRPSVHSNNVAQSPAIPAGQVLNVEVNKKNSTTCCTSSSICKGGFSPPEFQSRGFSSPRSF